MERNGVGWSERQIVGGKNEWRISNIMDKWLDLVGVGGGGSTITGEKVGRRAFPRRSDACVLVSCAVSVHWCSNDGGRRREKEKVEEEETEVGHRLPRRDATYTMRRDASAKRIGLVTSSFRKRPPSSPSPSPIRPFLSAQRKRRALMLQIHSAIKILRATSVRAAIVIKIDRA